MIGNSKTLDDVLQINFGQDASNSMFWTSLRDLEDEVSSGDTGIMARDPRLVILLTFSLI